MAFQIMSIALIILLCNALTYIFKMRRAEKEWRRTLENIQNGQRESKVFISDKGVIASISFLMNDIVESYNKEISELKKANEANKQILTSLSHDVRTPLASLKGYIDALHDGIVSNDEIPEYLSVASRKAADLETFVDMLFDWFKINSGEMQLAFSQCDINEISRELLIEWLPILEKQPFGIEINIADRDLVLPLDKVAYKRIVDNIIQNALVHSTGSKVMFSVSEENGMACVVIADNGWIPHEQILFLFDRLYKSDTARSGKGSGLGLAITRGLVLAHGGQISVDSTKEIGTVFTVNLPM